MNVALVNPPSLDGGLFTRDGRCTQEASIWSVQWPPLTLAYLAAIARIEGASVRLYDCPAAGWSLATLRERLRPLSPDLAVVSIATPTLDADRKTLDAIRRDHPEMHIAVIGVHATARDVETLDGCAAIDFAVRGEPEFTVRDLVRAVTGGDDPSAVVGLTSRTPDGARRNADRPFADDLDALPFPAWDACNLDLYRLPFRRGRLLSVAPLRGCPYRCSFCTARTYYGSKLRLRSPESVVAEMRAGVERFGVRDFFFWAETFTLDRAFVLALCEAVRRDLPGVRWTCNSRTDTVDPEMLAAMRAAGCWMVSFGVESSSAEVLARSRKNLRSADVAAPIRRAHAAGLVTLGHFILGLPGETPRSMRETIDLALALDLDFAQFYAAAPFVGSDLLEDAAAEGLLVDADGSTASQSRATLNLPGLSPDDVDRAVRRARWRFYLRRRSIARVLSVAGFGLFRQIGREISRRLRRAR